MTMANWRARSRAHKASQTPGKMKGDCCTTNPVKRFFATSPKAFRHPDYSRWHEEFKRKAMGAK